MSASRSPSLSAFRRALLLGVALAGAGLAGGCQKAADITNSITRGGSSEVAPTDPAALRHYTEELGRRYDTTPNDKTIVLRYARALRATGQLPQANAVLQRAAATTPNDLDVLGAYGKSLSDVGRLEDAANVLERAHTPERPSWSIYSAQGSVQDKLGQHANAQQYYEAALQIAPDEPSVLSNLGLSYALTRRLPLAEETLRHAAAQPRADARVRQNLALVLALQGKFGEAEDVARQALPPKEAAENIAQIRQMIAQSNTWRDLQTAKPARRASRPQVSEAQPARPALIAGIAEDD